jgi:hypothetical protein
MAAAVAAIIAEREWPAGLTSLGVTAASLAPDRPGLETRATASPNARRPGRVEP